MKRWISLITLFLPLTAIALGTVSGGLTGVNRGSSVFQNNQPGVPLLGVRNDGNSVLTSTDLTYAPLAITSDGTLKVNATTSEVATSVEGNATNSSSLFKLVAGKDTSNNVKALTLTTGGLLRVDTTISEQATAIPGAATTASSAFKMVAGRDGSNNAQPVKTDTSGELQVDVLTQPARAHGTDSIRLGDGTDLTLVSAAGALGVDLLQVGSNTISTGNGVTGTGSPRVTIASDNTAFSVNAAQSGTWNITNVSGTVSLPTGAATLAEQQTQTTALQLIDDPVVATGGTSTVKAYVVAGTDGARNQALKIDASGELQVDVLTMPSVTIVAPSVSTTTLSRPSNSASSFVVLASNTSRKGAIIYNDSTTNCYVKFGATASTSSYTVKLFATDTYVMDPPIYTGAIDGICDAASGSLQVTEL